MFDVCVSRCVDEGRVISAWKAAQGFMRFQCRFAVCGGINSTAGSGRIQGLVGANPLGAISTLQIGHEKRTKKCGCGEKIAPWSSR